MLLLLLLGVDVGHGGVQGHPGMARPVHVLRSQNSRVGFSSFRRSRFVNGFNFS
jgi:hypothetical protein